MCPFGLNASLILISLGRHAWQETRRAHREEEGIGIAVRNERPQRRYSGLLASLSRS